MDQWLSLGGMHIIDRMSENNHPPFPIGDDTQKADMRIDSLTSKISNRLMTILAEASLRFAGMFGLFPKPLPLVRDGESSSVVDIFTRPDLVRHLIRVGSVDVVAGAAMNRTLLFDNDKDNLLRNGKPRRTSSAHTGRLHGFP